MNRRVFLSHIAPLMALFGWVLLWIVLRWDGYQLNAFTGDRGIFFGVPVGLGLLLLTVSAFLPQEHLEKNGSWMPPLGFLLTCTAFLRPDEGQLWSIPAWSGIETWDGLRAMVIFVSLGLMAKKWFTSRELPAWSGFLSLALAIPFSFESLVTWGTGFSILLGLTLAYLGLHMMGKQPDDLPHSAKKTFEVGALVVVITTFLLLKLQAMGPTASDENVYFYQAWRVAQGDLPYRDFFFAHPPLHLALPALVFGIFGFSLILAKSLAPLLSVAAGLCLWRLCRVSKAPWVGISALVLFLFATATLKASTNLTGVNTTVFLFLAGMLALKRRRDLLAGALLAASVGAGFYIIAPVLILLCWELWARGKQSGRFLGGFAVATALLQGFFVWVGGKEFIQGVYTYHFLKPASQGSRQALLDESGFHPSALLHNFFNEFLSSKSLLGQLYYDGALWALAFSAIGFVLFASGLRLTTLRSIPKVISLPENGYLSHGWLFLGLFLGLALEFSMFQELHSHYYALMIPFLVLLATWLLSSISPAIAKTRFPDLPRWARWIPLLLLMMAFVGGGSLRYQASSSAWPEEKVRAGELVDYEWRVSPVLPEIDPIVRGLFWMEARERGRNHPPSTHYLWSKKRWFSTAEDIATLVATQTHPNQTITGASSIAPLIALLSNRDLAAHEADTNSKRFKSGILTEEDFVESICNTSLGAVIGTKRSYFSKARMMRSPFWAHYFNGLREFGDSQLRNNGIQKIQVYRRVLEQESCKWRK